MTDPEKWSRIDLIGTEDLAREEIDLIFDFATHFKASLKDSEDHLGHLKGKTIVNLFMEPSTRTRVAFEIAAQNLGANVISIAAASSSLTKGESLRDTALNVQALQADIIVVRHSSPGSPLYLSNLLDIPVVNAGDGAHEHPTQALLDCFTLKERWGNLDGKRIVILGDILFSRVARSNIHAMKTLGAKVTVAGPPTLVPKAFEAMGVEVSHDLQKALKDADGVMLLRIQHERQTSTHFPSLVEYTRMFGLNQERANWMKDDVVIMHPGPINRGVEIDSALADSERSVILEQVTNGIVCRMAVLYLCFKAYERQLIKKA
jgi:aspartate carbamoyltransferase catalytic subunit